MTDGHKTESVTGTAFDGGAGVDSRFYCHLATVSVEAIASEFDGSLSTDQQTKTVLSTIGPVESAGSAALTYCDDTKKFAASLENSQAGAILVSRKAVLPANTEERALRVDHPKLVYARLARRMFAERSLEPGPPIHPTADIDASAIVEPGAVIGANVRIGSGSRIRANAVIHPGVMIGRNVQIGPGTSIQCTLLGDNVRIGANSCIGGPGFGLVTVGGVSEDLPHFGRVIIQDSVSLGSNTCVDRGAFEDTLLGEGTKVDNLVHIAHNCQIGRNVVIIACSGLSGSVSVGDGAILAGAVGVADHISIGRGAILAARSGVIATSQLVRYGRDIQRGRGGNGCEKQLGFPSLRARHKIDETGRVMSEVETAAVEEIGIEEVLKLLPHRYPLLLVDRASHYVPMKSIRGYKAVTFNEPHFQGHFPGKPVMPGVLLIEAMAQTGAILMSKSLNVNVEENVVFFMSVDACRFRQPVVPGDMVEMLVDATAHRQSVFKFKGICQVRGRKVAEAEFAAMVMPREA